MYYFNIYLRFNYSTINVKVGEMRSPKISISVFKEIFIL